MYFIGDVHGKIENYRNILHDLPVGAKSIQVGDMGIGFRGVYLHEGGVMSTGNHRFIRGNHDNPEKCKAHKHYLGDYGVLPEEGIFYLGGAWSIDAAYRTPGVSWWPGEELSSLDLQAASELYAEFKPRIVVSHEAPSRAAYYMVSGTALPYTPHEPCPCDDAVYPKGSEYKEYKSQVGFANTRTSQYLQQMWDKHTPEHWIFGHYHIDKEFELQGTKLRCVNELKVVAVD